MLHHLTFVGARDVVRLCLMKTKALLLAFALTYAAPGYAQDLTTKVQEVIAANTIPGTRIGVLVTDETGKEIVSVNADQRFIPASNTKIYSTVAAFHTMPDIHKPDVAAGTAVRLEGKNVALIGFGDARLSSAPDCKVNCLATLADAVAAKTKRVANVIGDDTLFPDQRWSAGMAWNNMPSRYGTAISALTLDDNEVVVKVKPAKLGEKPSIETNGYLTVENHAVTIGSGKTSLSYDREPNSRVLRLTGFIREDAAGSTLVVGLSDPAHFTAWRFKQLLEERGVKVTGAVEARHRMKMPQDEPSVRGTAPIAPFEVGDVLARLEPAPLFEDLIHINKVSQNLHTELLVRRVGRLQGTGSISDGIVRLEEVMEKAGAARTSWDFSDGSGMSTYNRVSPRATVQLLNWVNQQQWGAQFRETLPIAGVDGTLRSRFPEGSLLNKKLFAKTGSLNQTSALGGYMIAKSGKALTFAIYANDMPGDVSGTPVMDAVLNLIAEAN